MSDVIDELRAANPVDRSTLEVPPALARRVTAHRGQRRRRPRRTPILAATGAVAAVALAVALIHVDGGGGLSLADKAYAATTGAGVRHWKITIRTFIDGRRRGIVERQEGWQRGGTLHVLLFDGRRLVTDLRETPSVTRTWGAGMNDYDVVPTAKGRASGPLQLGDPFAAFRHAHETGQLIRLNTTTYRALPDPHGFPSGATLTYRLDPRTALPRSATLAYTRDRGPTPSAFDGASYRIVFTYDSYVRLADTRANRAKLSLLPHPGAGPSRTDARAKFALLRDGSPLTAAQRHVVAVLAKAGLFAKGRFDPADARRGPRGVILVPGHGYVGMVRGGGGTMATVDVAVRRGMAINGSAVDRGRRMYVVAPDGVTAIRAHYHGHPWRTFPVRQNVAVLPHGGYRFRFVRRPG